MRDFPANADYEGTVILLKVLREHDVKATFGIVGQAALPGEPPDHCQDQIRTMYRAGHEIASHSMTHRFLPPMRDDELLEEVILSKQSLEACIDASVQGFIPPFNRPSHFPRGGAFSISEVFGLNGRGRGRQSIDTMLRTLSAAGYGWSRVSFQNKFCQLGLRLGARVERPPMQPFIYHDMVAIPLHQTGFGPAALKLIRRWLNTDIILTLYGHPNQAFSANGQNARELDWLLYELRSERNEGRLEFNTMGEITMLARAGCADASREMSVRKRQKAARNENERLA